METEFEPYKRRLSGPLEGERGTVAPVALDEEVLSEAGRRRRR